MHLNILVFFFMVCAVAIPSRAQEWTDMEGMENFWIKENARYSSQGLPTREFQFDSFRFDRVDYEYEITHMEDILRDAYPEITNDYIVFDEEADASRVVRPNMEEAWNYFSDDKSVVALVPVGFSEIAGEARIAGYRKRDGVVEGAIFAAPNLDTIFCLNDVDEHENRRDKGLMNYPGQIPFLFPVEYSSTATYQYLEDIKAVNLGTKYDPSRFRETFENCRDMIQVGYMVIAPRDVEVDEDSNFRISHGPSALNKLRPFERVVMSYDRFGYLNFTRSQGPSHVHDFGKLLSSDEYYDNEECRYGENRSYPSRSQSCELWGVTISAFDGAAIYLRTPSMIAPIIWGDGSRTSPGVMVIRRREQMKFHTSPDVVPKSAADVLRQATP